MLWGIALSCVRQAPSIGGMSQVGGSVPMLQSLVRSLHCAKTLGIAASAKPLRPVRRLLPTSLGLLLSGRLRILLKRFVRLGSFADHTDKKPFL